MLIHLPTNAKRVWNFIEYYLVMALLKSIRALHYDVDVGFFFMHGSSTEKDGDHSASTNRHLLMLLRFETQVSALGNLTFGLSHLRTKPTTLRQTPPSQIILRLHFVVPAEQSLPNPTTLTQTLFLHLKSTLHCKVRSPHVPPSSTTVWLCYLELLNEL